MSYINMSEAQVTSVGGEAVEREMGQAQNPARMTPSPTLRTPPKWDPH